MGDGRHQVRRSILATLAGIVGAVVPSVAICALGPGLGAGIGPGYLVLYTLIGGATSLVSTLAPRGWEFPRWGARSLECRAARLGPGLATVVRIATVVRDETDDGHAS